MTRTRLALPILVALLSTSARADLTLRWNMNWKFTEGLPSQFTQAAGAQAALTPQSMTIRYSKGRAFMEQGSIRMVADYDKGVITMIDPEGKRLATMQASEYPPKLDTAAGLPPEARKIFEQMTFDVQSKRPGRFDTIRGIKTEEHEIRMAMTMPTPAASFEMNFIMSQWMPTAAEVQRVPVLRQCAEFVTRAKGSMDPTSMMQKAFGSFPGLGEKFKGVFDEMLKSAPTVGLRMRMTLIMPSLAKMVEPLRSQGIALPENFDGTIGNLLMEVDQMDESPVPDSAFAIPEGYQTVPMMDLFKAMAASKQHPH
jgi:hypothetical protein